MKEDVHYPAPVWAHSFSARGSPQINTLEKCLPLNILRVWHIVLQANPYSVLKSINSFLHCSEKELK